MFKKILIANRGEIAVRVIRSCRRLGVSTVAVFSEVDREALHVQMADEAYCIGPARSDLSYLNIPNLLSLAQATRCEAIHPGYGFLSENRNFAEITAKCGFVFIGPPPAAIGRMGQKSVARDLMQRSGVPVMPGSTGSLEDPAEALKVAREVGFPVLIKASAGGGGKGMRLVESEAEFEAMFNMARTEAQAAFGDGRVYVEKYLRQPRHIEIQVLADEHGNVIALGERECSIQRRHQKLVEEAPSPVLTPELRQRMMETAVRAARAIEYRNAGTIEFLLSQDGEFYFMEMNTRLQVEHPVTEMVYGYDLVEQQLRIAAGEPLTIKQEDVVPRGWAVECRINAEDVRHGFAPCPGRIHEYLPPGGPWVRVDSAAYTGYTVSPHYDSMVAKLIVWAPDRLAALDRMEAALREYVIRGIATTIPLHRLIMKHPEFRSGQFSTGFIPQHIDSLLEQLRHEPTEDGEPAAVATTTRPAGPGAEKVLTAGA
ncbi:MAG: Biotin carboxylase of acetyl-CoA carboxylase [Candidatus Ozemobacter sibiricus]|uniref:Biotin carboxylase n=1 Tax=Candidatus Ozemobacter sibiricus TaxID=2268124 RepID=A0A367ZUP2_9BACT|nr:MAG: Biotin carboxylase of acetyl-CoA carboxylase [Candidatus Ozemobacter sibiricus]